jgi:membrane protein implicated in regulation of membrane protease activity
VIVFLGICFTGLLILIISAFLGDHDFGSGLETDAGGIQGCLSMKVISIFLVMFGASGALYLSYEDNLFTAIAVGLVVAFIFSFFVKKLLELLYRQQATSTITTDAFTGITGEVKIDIPEHGLGEIACIVRSKRIYIPAREKNNKSLCKNTVVRIIRYDGNSAVVEE